MSTYKQRKAVYAGSFDPPTNGHLWMIRKAHALFDSVVVAIGVNPDKHCTYSVAERKQMLEDIIHGEGFDNITVDVYENSFLVDYADSIAATYILRGIRTLSDYEYERSMRYINSDFHSEVSSIFLMPPREFAEVSSTMVKGLVGPANWQEMIQRYVPSAVFNKMKQDYLEKQGKDQ